MVEINNGLKTGYPKDNRTKHPLHATYSNMISRCYLPSNKAYANYGGRGIVVCQEWLEKVNGFWNFVGHIGDRPSPRHSIDRIDNDGNYEPGNVRWATDEEQASNRRSNVRISMNGLSYTIPQWSKILNIPTGTLMGRRKRLMSDEEVLKVKNKLEPCRLNNCERIKVSRGLCHMHYKSEVRNGNITIDISKAL